ncbi:hypothetical protein COL922a_010351 [Colletotrichum nupharicola]|nr:hypothetical protein COL922a_010351 [Colletotrichum nupharicola]
MTSIPAYDSDQTVQGEPSLIGTSNSSTGLTVTFQDVSIRVHGMGEDFGSTCLSVLGDLIPFGKSKKSQRLLVLGRPGSGCTSLLKIISNQREEFHHVSGDVRYGNLGQKGAQQFRNQIVMNTEGKFTGV